VSFIMAKSVTSAAPASAATLAGSGEHYAIVVDGGRQYRVAEGQEFEIDFRHLAPGSELVFERVLAISKDGKLTIGKPVVKGATVKASVIGPVLGDKIYVQKFARRKNYRRRTGHRSISTKVRIASIAG
jgi:large subunit ribosomal protein L21